MSNFIKTIDVSDCVGDSLAKHNYNFLSLDQTICNLSSQFLNQNNNYYTVFSDLCANIERFNKFADIFEYPFDINEATTATKYMSAYWHKTEINFTFPINIYKDNTSIYYLDENTSDDNFKNWGINKLKKAYPETNFISGTFANIFFLLHSNLGKISSIEKTSSQIASEANPVLVEFLNDGEYVVPSGVQELDVFIVGGGGSGGIAKDTSEYKSSATIYSTKGTPASFGEYPSGYYRLKYKSGAWSAWSYGNRWFWGGLNIFSGKTVVGSIGDGIKYLTPELANNAGIIDEGVVFYHTGGKISANVYDGPTVYGDNRGSVIYDLYTENFVNGGGGGGGGILYLKNLKVTPYQKYNIKIGNGGINGNGGNSSFGNYSVTGGFAGIGVSTGISGSGNSNGSGGASGLNGQDGIVFDKKNKYYGGGGGGGNNSSVLTIGGLGGGGKGGHSNYLNSISPYNSEGGKKNTGGGGGGASKNQGNGANGGSGIVIVIQKTPTDSVQSTRTYNVNQTKEDIYIKKMRIGKYIIDPLTNSWTFLNFV